MCTLNTVHCVNYQTDSFLNACLSHHLNWVSTLVVIYNIGHPCFRFSKTLKAEHDQNKNRVYQGFWLNLGKQSENFQVTFNHLKQVAFFQAAEICMSLKPNPHNQVKLVQIPATQCRGCFLTGSDRWSVKQIYQKTVKTEQRATLSNDAETDWSTKKLLA